MDVMFVIFDMYNLIIHVTCVHIFLGFHLVIVVQQKSDIAFPLQTWASAIQQSPFPTAK
jgi:hypothetical protein